MNTQDKVKQLITFSTRNGAELAARLRVIRQSYPEAMVADQVLEIDVRDYEPATVTQLIVALVNNGMAVERLTITVNNITHLRIWSRKEQSACAQQHQFVINQLAGAFEFVDGWQWINDDPRDLIFEPLQRLDDQRTWAVGARYGIEDGGPHGIWNRGTLVVRFAAPDSTEVEDIGIYIKNGDRVMKLAPGRSFEATTDVPPVMF